VFNNVTAAQNNTMYQLVITNGYGSTNSPPVTLTVLSGPPIIETDLQAQYEVYSGYPLILAVVAGGTQPLSYQWMHNSTNLSDNAHVSGSLSNTLVIATTAAGDAGTYQLIVSNSLGTSNSIAASVTILPVLGFNGLGNGWSLHNELSGEAQYVSSNVLQLTDSIGNEGAASFFD